MKFFRWHYPSWVARVVTNWYQSSWFQHRTWMGCVWVNWSYKVPEGCWENTWTIFESSGGVADREATITVVMGHKTKMGLKIIWEKAECWIPQVVRWFGVWGNLFEIARNEVFFEVMNSETNPESLLSEICVCRLAGSRFRCSTVRGLYGDQHQKLLKFEVLEHWCPKTLE
jgi:hypothetical protein